MPRTDFNMSLYCKSGCKKLSVSALRYQLQAIGTGVIPVRIQGMMLCLSCSFIYKSYLKRFQKLFPHLESPF